MNGNSAAKKVETAEIGRAAGGIAQSDPVGACVELGQAADSARSGVEFGKIPHADGSAAAFRDRAARPKVQHDRINARQLGVRSFIEDDRSSGKLHAAEIDRAAAVDV